MDDSPRDVSAYIPPSPVVSFKTRKKRYYFREGDDIVFLQTVLNEQRLFSLVREYRVSAWDTVTASLNHQGILASTHSLRNRLKRLVENLHENVARGKTTAEFTTLEHLLAKYAEAEAEYRVRKATSGLPVPQSDQVQFEHYNHGNHRELLSTKAEEDSPRNILVPPFRVLSPVSVSIESVQTENTKKSSFVFQEWHDVLLLQAMLADQGTLAAPGRKKPNWDDITTSLNDHGLRVDTETLRNRLQLLVNLYRKDLSFDVAPRLVSKKKLLLKVYCSKLDAHQEEGDETASMQRNVGNKRPLPVTKSAESVRIEIPGFVVSHESPQAQKRTLPTQQTEKTTALSEEVVQQPSKKLKLSPQVILQRFVENELQKEEHERARFSAQQEFQQQTIDLQRRSLEIQHKALAMQDKLMELMEKVVNKL